MPDFIPLNGAILSHWQNWARVLLMVAIAAIAFDLIGRNIRVRKEVN